MLNKKYALVAVLAITTFGNVFAGTLTSYAIGDVLVCFRKPGNANDLVVDAGPVSTLVNGTINQRIAINEFTGSQLAVIGTNSTTWSAFTWYDDTVSPTSAQYDLFISRARVFSYRQSTPWYAQDVLSQQLTAGDMSTIPPGAAYNLSYNGASTAAAIIEPDDTSGNSPYYPAGHGNCYDFQVGGTGNSDFNGDWEGNVEITTPSSFTTAGNVVRSDFYQMSPTDTGSGLTTYLGFFELNTNGAMTFVAKPTAPTVTTLAASGIAKTNAQLNATINPQNDGTTMYFQYGLTTSYGSNSVTANIGTTSGTYGLSISNLTAGMTYYYRAVAYNREGTNVGAGLNFTTTGGGVLVAPVITGFVRTNNISYVSFSTGNSGTYTLRGTNSAGLASGVERTNWPAIGSVGGNGMTNTLQDPATVADKFYLISAQ